MKMIMLNVRRTAPDTASGRAMIACTRPIPELGGESFQLVSKAPTIARLEEANYTSEVVSKIFDDRTEACNTIG